MNEMFIKVKRRLRKIPTKMILDFGNYQNTVFVAGSARSGTTWLEEIINYDHQYRLMFEPFHPAKVESIHDWKYFQYIRPSDDSDRYLLPMRKILSGKIKNEWIDRFNTRIIVNKRIIKAIHANLLLFWVKKQFPRIPIIFILRHPCAVVNSKLNIAGDFFPHSNNPLDNFLNQNELICDFLMPYESQIRKEKTKFEELVFMWCIENLIPLRLFQNGELHLCFYENLCTEPEKEIQKIFNHLHKNFPNEVLNSITKPSIMSKQESAIKTGKDLISSWRESISQDQIRRAVAVLNLFGLDILYNDHDLPLVDSLEILDRF